MTYCDDCIHYDVCGKEDAREEAITYCAYKKTEPKTDTLDKIRAEIDVHREKIKSMAADDWYAGKIRGYDCAINIIDKYKALEQEPCEDAVSRREVFETFGELLGVWGTEALMELSSVTPQPKTGHWEWVQYDGNPNIGNWHCSECGSIVIECVSKEKKGGIPLYKYCPQCGVKIE